MENQLDSLPPDSNYPRGRTETMARLLQLKRGYKTLHTIVFRGFVFTALLSCLLLLVDSVLMMCLVGACSIVVWCILFVRYQHRIWEFEVESKSSSTALFVFLGVFGAFCFSKREYFPAIGIWVYAHVWIHLNAWQMIHKLGFSQRVLFVKNKSFEQHH